MVFVIPTGRSGNSIPMVVAHMVFPPSSREQAAPAAHGCYLTSPLM
jgi:hypothetical protein